MAELNPNIILQGDMSQIFNPVKAEAQQQQLAEGRFNLQMQPLKAQAMQQKVASDDMELQKAKMEHGLQLLQFAKGKPDAWQSVKQSAIQAGFPAQMIPDQYDENFINQATMALLDTKDKFAMSQFEETKRHNRAIEDLQNKRLGGGAPYVDPDTGEIVEPQRKLSATEQKEIFDSSDLVSAADNAKSALTRATDMLDGKSGAVPYSGFGSGVGTIAARITGGIIGDKERGAATTEYSNLITEQALSNLKATFGGNPTEGERQVLLKLQALSDYDVPEQKRILSNASLLADKRIAFNKKKIDAINSGNYRRMGDIGVYKDSDAAPTEPPSDALAEAKRRGLIK